MLCLQLLDVICYSVTISPTPALVYICWNWGNANICVSWLWDPIAAVSNQLYVSNDKKVSAAEWQIWNGAPHFPTSTGLQVPNFLIPTASFQPWILCQSFPVALGRMRKEKQFQQHIFIADLSCSWFMDQFPGFGSRNQARHTSCPRHFGPATSCWWTWWMFPSFGRLRLCSVPVSKYVPLRLEGLRPEHRLNVGQPSHSRVRRDRWKRQSKIKGSQHEYCEDVWFACNVWTETPVICQWLSAARMVPGLGIQHFAGGELVRHGRWVQKVWWLLRAACCHPAGDGCSWSCGRCVFSWEIVFSNLFMFKRLLTTWTRTESSLSWECDAATPLCFPLLSLVWQE